MPVVEKSVAANDTESESMAAAKASPPESAGAPAAEESAESSGAAQEIAGTAQSTTPADTETAGSESLAVTGNSSHDVTATPAAKRGGKDVPTAEKNAAPKSESSKDTCEPGLTRLGSD